MSDGFTYDPKTAETSIKQAKTVDSKLLNMSLDEINQEKRQKRKEERLAEKKSHAKPQEKPRVKPQEKSQEKEKKKDKPKKGDDGIIDLKVNRKALMQFLKEQGCNTMGYTVKIQAIPIKH